MKKLIISLVAGLALMGAVFGAANAITLGGVAALGSGQAAVATSGTTTSIVWSIVSTDTTKIDGATVKLTTDTLAGDAVCVQVSDSSGPTILANGCVDPGITAIGDPIVVAFDNSPSLTAAAAA